MSHFEDSYQFNQSQNYGNRDRSRPRDFRVFHEEFRGNPTFAIYAVDENGERLEPRPVISLGKFKARLVLRFIEELRTWVGPDRGPRGGRPHGQG